MTLPDLTGPTLAYLPVSTLDDLLVLADLVVPTLVDLSGRYTVRCNRADIAVGVSSYNDIEPRALHGLTHATCHSD